MLVDHEANLRAREVDEIFNGVGIVGICAQACSSDAILDWFCAAHGLNDLRQKGVNKNVIEERLNDIVERRNQVAHHGCPPDNLPGSEFMSDAVAFIDSFSTSIFCLVAGLYLKNHHADSSKSTELVLSQRDGPYKDGTIVVVNKPVQRIFVGQPIFALVKSTGARWGRIQSLRIDGTDVQEVASDDNAPNGVGVGLDFKFPKSADAKLIALSANDDVVWSG